MHEKHWKYVLFSLIGLYTVLFGLFTWERHQRLQSAVFDLGIFDQALYLISRGENLFLTTRGLHVHADHFHPVLYLAAPLYLFWSSPYALLLLQTFILGLGAYPVYCLGRHHGIPSPWSVTLALAYLAHPTVSFLNRFDFHPVSFMTTALLFAALYLEREQKWPYALSLILALSCTEAAGFTVLALACTAFFLRDIKWAAGTFLTGVLGIVGARLSLAHFNPHTGSPYSALYTDYADSLLGVVKHLLFHPIDTLLGFFNPVDLEYLFYLFGPLLLLPLLGPARLLPILPTLLGNLLAWRYSQHRVEFHYGAAIAPFLLWAAVVGWARVSKRGVSEPVLGSVLLLVSAASIYFGPTGFNHTSRFGAKVELGSLQEELPPDFTLSADALLGSHFSQRRDLYVFPNPFLPSAWDNSTAGLVQQASVEYRPFSRGQFRRGMELTQVDGVLLPQDRERRSDFPLGSGDSAFARFQVMRSQLFKTPENYGETILLRRKESP